MTHLENRNGLREQRDTGADGSAPEKDRGLIVLHSFGGDGSETLVKGGGSGVSLKGVSGYEVIRTEGMRIVCGWAACRSGKVGARCAPVPSTVLSSRSRFLPVPGLTGSDGISRRCCRPLHDCVLRPVSLKRPTGKPGPLPFSTMPHQIAASPNCTRVPSLRPSRPIPRDHVPDPR